MGGGKGFFEQLQQQAPQFTDEQIMGRVQGEYGKELADKYQAEVLKQLRDESYSTPYAVYQNVFAEADQKTPQGMISSLVRSIGERAS